MNGNPSKSSSSRPRRIARFGNQTSQLDSFEIGKKGKIPRPIENWRDELLASGPSHRVHFKIGSVTVARLRHAIPFIGENRQGRKFFCSAVTAAHFTDHGDRIDQFYPAMGDWQ